MLAEIALDPTTYLSLGASALAKNATTTGIKALGYADDAARLVKGVNLKNVQKVLKTTKTFDQALDVAKTADKASDLMRASKLYRAADTLDTIANPLKLIPAGTKKAGSAALGVVDRINPELGTSVRKMGEEFTKTFNYSKFLKSNLGDDVYKRIKRVESVSEASLEATSEIAGKQQKLFEKMLKNIKKDPDRIWTLTSKVDGSMSTFTFKGLTDDDIMKKLNEFATNQVYFNRPTVLNEDSIKLLIRNNGQLKIAAQDFADPKDLKSFTKALKSVVDDPDLVSVKRYVQPQTGKESGWVIDIGKTNAKSLSDNLDNISKNIQLQDDVIAKRTAQKEALTQRYKDLQVKIKDNKLKQTQLEKSLKGLDKTSENFVDLKKELTKTKRTTALLESNLARMKSTSIAKSDELLNLAKQEVKTAKVQQKLANDLFKTRELIPFESPIIDIPEMKEVADLQKQLIDTNLGIRNLAGMNINQMDIYDSYIHRKLTDTSKAYLERQNAKKNPVVSFLIGANDKLPAQSAITNLYGNFSPVEVNTMAGFDLFDANVISSNLDMVNKLNRRSYNSQLTRELFTQPNEWVYNLRNLDDAAQLALQEKGFVPISSTEIARKLKLNEILNEQDIAKITKGLKNQKFLMSQDVIDLFDKNVKLYKQLDSQFYQQLNKYMKYWKGGNLLSVGYHLRNIVGAQTNMALAGMGLDDIAKYTSQAGIDITKYNTKLLPEFRKWLLDPTNANIFKSGTLDDVTKAFAKQVGVDDAKLFTELLDAQMNGAWGSIVGQHDAVKRAIGEMPKSKLGKVADKVQDINYKLGATADDINRLASYRWAQNPKNYSKIMKVGAEDALDFVNYAMFDFKSMSPTEQAYFTKLFPFYNFIKNNLVFQFDNMTKNAQNYKNLARAYKNLYSAQELTNEDVQQYVKDQLYIPIRQADGSIKVLKVAPPVQDATNLLSLKNLLGATNPLIQYITDRAYGEDLYTGADLGDRDRNTQEFIDILPYGRSIRTTLKDPLSILLPVSNTTVEKGRNQNAYAELERLEKLRKQYKQQTGKSLPTLEELGLK